LSESEQIVNRLRSRGGEVWYLQARDEGHGFGKKHNRDAYYRTFAQFLTQALRAEPTKSVRPENFKDGATAAP
jgi:dipeptidyl aminopeptidase/acylaminoacyl peptidase